MKQIIRAVSGSLDFHLIVVVERNEKLLRLRKKAEEQKRNDY
jgi:hypothetical protein